eukprot:5477225-Amphidinium_carterae.1
MAKLAYRSNGKQAELSGAEFDEVDGPAATCSNRHSQGYKFMHAKNEENLDCPILFKCIYKVFRSIKICRNFCHTIPCRTK